MGSVFDGVMAGLNEVVEIEAGRAEPARVYVPKDVDVRATRKRLKLSQQEFAMRFGFTLSQLRDWEQARTRPAGGARAYLTLIERSPEGVLNLIESTRDKAA